MLLQEPATCKPRTIIRQGLRPRSPLQDPGGDVSQMLGFLLAAQDTGSGTAAVLLGYPLAHSTGATAPSW